MRTVNSLSGDFPDAPYLSALKVLVLENLKEARSRKFPVAGVDSWRSQKL